MQNENNRIFDEWNVESLGALLSCGFMVLEAGAKGKLLYYNPAVVKMLGYDSVQEMLGVSGGEGSYFVYPDDRAAVAAEAERPYGDEGKTRSSA